MQKTQDLEDNMRRHSSIDEVVVSKIISITVPNLHKHLLDQFLINNIDLISEKTELIIVSSSVTNESLKEYRCKYPSVRFVPIKQNKGFADTVNTGFRLSSGEWVGTVNDDVILKSGWSVDLTKNKDPRKVGSINPLIVDLNGTIESAGIKIEDKGKARCITQKPSTAVEVDATNGACVIYSRYALSKVGLFAELFTSYLEDVDLSLRLRKAGFINIVDPTVEVIHLGHQTMNIESVKKRWLDFKNWCLVIIRNWGWKKIIRNFPAICIERMRNISGIFKALGGF
ncbi:MAG: glycosyltransferase family 2 protein [Patescibacteria group bacterium]